VPDQQCGPDLGHLGADGEITWSASSKYDSGVLPTVAFTSSNTVREIHKSQSNSQNWSWNGAVSANSVASCETVEPAARA